LVLVASFLSYCIAGELILIIFGLLGGGGGNVDLFHKKFILLQLNQKTVNCRIFL
jgi:hypothetical protein